MGVKMSYGSYGNHFVSGGRNYNALYCYNSTGNMAIIGNTRSGNAYVFDNNGVRQTPRINQGSLETCRSYLGTDEYTNYWFYGHGATEAWPTWI